MLEIKAEKFYQMLAFVPVNEQRTKLYIRTYQAFLTLPILKPLLDRLFNYQSMVILKQDKYAVISHNPNSSIHATDEKLYPSDRAIAWYRQKWIERETEIGIGSAKASFRQETHLKTAINR
jgi:hypothetical protein